MHSKNKLASFLHFAIPSSLGLFFFLIPIGYGGNTKVPIAHLSIILHNYIDSWWPAIIVALLVIAASLSCFVTLCKLQWIKAYPWLESICVVSPIWLTIRVIGAILGVVSLFNIGKGILPANI